MNEHFEENPLEGDLVIPFVIGNPGAVDLSDPEVREDLNDELDVEVDKHFNEITVAYDRVRDLLSEVGYIVPVHDAFTEPSHEEVYVLSSNGVDGESSVFYLYFAYVKNDLGFEVIAEILTQDELNDLFDGE